MMSRLVLAWLTFGVATIMQTSAWADSPGHAVQLSAGYRSSSKEDDDGESSTSYVAGGFELRYDYLLPSRAVTTIVGIDGGWNPNIGSVHARIGFEHRWITLTTAFGALIVYGEEDSYSVFDFRGNLRLFPREVFYLEVDAGNTFDLFTGRETMSMRFGTEAIPWVGLELGWAFPIGIVAGAELRLPHDIRVGIEGFHQFVFDSSGMLFTLSWSMAPTRG